MTLSKKDIRNILITGLTTGIVAWRVFLFLGKTDIAGLPVEFLVFVFPVLWALGVQFGYLLGQWMPFFNQFGRFAAIGFTNFAVDSGVLYLFIASFHATSGIYFTLFKTASFCVAIIHSYLWNRTWSFEQKQGVGGREFISFALVAGLSLLLNVSIATLVAGLSHGVSNEIWAGVAAIAGSAAALVFSFIGFRLLVFKR